MSDFTISNEFTLPSKGLIYDPQIQPVIKLRSMTTEDEMKRLGHSERPNKILCDIIDDCIVGNKPAISSYDMCLADYQFLLHSLRIVTYGTTYKLGSVCPYCASQNTHELDLSELEVREFSDDLRKYMEITLPTTKKLLKLRPQTPHSLDDIAIRKKGSQKKGVETTSDMSLLYTLETIVDTVDGEHFDSFRLQNLLRKLPMADTNYILQSAKMLNEFMGLSTDLTFVCPECGLDYKSSFRITSEFFGPSIN